jgi:hypothetical protein
MTYCATSGRTTKSQLCCVKCVLSWEAGCQPSFSFPGRSMAGWRAEGWASQIILEAVCPAATRIPPILRRSLVFQSIESWVVWRREGRGRGGHWLYSLRHTFYEVGFQEPTNASANLGLRRRRIGPLNLQAETGRRGGKDSLFTRTRAIQAVFEINGMNREEGLEADHHDTHLQESRGMFDVPLPLPVSSSSRLAVCAMGRAQKRC